MKTIIFTSDSNGLNAVGASNPLPVVITAGASGRTFQASFVSNNAITPVTVESGVAGKSLYITDVTISVSGAARVDLRDGDGTSYLSVYLAANGTFTKSFSSPIKITAAKDLMLRSSTAVSVAATISGYIA